MRRTVLAVLLAAGVAVPMAAPAWAISDPSEALHDPAQEARAEAIGRQLRCLVCQNESIEDSAADLARDLRKIVRQRVAAGDSDRAIVDWLVARYGNFVRLSPPLTPVTVFLWGSPVLALLVGAAAVVFSRGRSEPPAPLDQAEKSRLERLLNT